MFHRLQVHAEQHFKGIRHAKRLKMLETTKDNPGLGNFFFPYSVDRLVMDCFTYCHFQIQADQHFKGVRHSKRLKMLEEGRKSPGLI